MCLSLRSMGAAATSPAPQRHRQTEARHKSQRVSKAKQKEEGEEQRRAVQSRAEHKTDQSRAECAVRCGNQEIPLDTSAFIRHYNEFL